MGAIQSIKLSREEVDRGRIPTNYVMVESDMTIEGKKTKGGLIYGHDEDIQFAEEGTSWEADVADVFGRVYKVPQKLYYNKEDPNNSMGWDCDMEVQVGDTVWFSPLEGRNATAIECEGKFYKLLPYSDLIVTKREDNLAKYLGKELVIMLNGRVLLEYVNLENKSSLAISGKGDVDKTKGIIRHLGKPNREYIQDVYNDFVDLEMGDLVLLNPGTPQVPLERKSFNAYFDGDKLYFVVQRRRIAMVLSKGN